MIWISWALGQANLDFSHGEEAPTHWRGDLSWSQPEEPPGACLGEGEASQRAYFSPHPGGTLTLSGQVTALEGKATVSLEGGGASEHVERTEPGPFRVDFAIPQGATKLEIRLEATKKACFSPLDLGDPTETVKRLSTDASQGPFPEVPPEIASDVVDRAVSWEIGAVAKRLAAFDIVQLGESNHTVAQFNTHKVELIRELHREHGFSVVAFESGLWGCDRANSLEGTAREQLEACLFAVWHTEEVLELFEYAIASRKTDHPLRLAGVDVQWTSKFEREGVPAWIEESVAKVSLERAKRLALLLEEDRSIEQIPELEAHHAWLTSKRKKLARRLGKAESELLLQEIRAQIWLCTHRSNRELDARDEGMADNLVWLANVRHPGEKIVVWAHNFHIREAGSAQGSASMGEFARVQLGERLHTVGLYAGRGLTMQGWNPVEQRLPLEGSLEAKLAAAGPPGLYLTLDAPWAEESMPTWDHGWQREDLVPADQFDAILFFDTISPAVLLED